MIATGRDTREHVGLAADIDQLSKLRRRKAELGQEVSGLEARVREKALAAIEKLAADAEISAAEIAAHFRESAGGETSRKRRNGTGPTPVFRNDAGDEWSRGRKKNWVIEAEAAGELERFLVDAETNQTPAEMAQSAGTGAE